MKTSFLNSFFICISSFAIANKVNAFSPADTSKNNLLACVDKSEKEVKVVKAANVVYPAIFTGHEKESMGYIEKFSVNRKDYLIRTFKRSKKYFPKVTAILKKQNVPAEFAVLMALESGFNPNAVSGAGAVGYWQIMDDVAKEYGLKIPVKEKVVAKKSKLTAKENSLRKKQKVQADDRKNFARSTNAAARYLKDRSRNLAGDWLLIAASYNCGVGNVWDAMEKCGKKNPGFWDIKSYLPAETRAYVMNFIALNVIFKNYENFTKNNLCFKPILASYPQQDSKKDAVINTEDLK